MQAIQQTKTHFVRPKLDREKIRKGWEKLKDYNGICGATTMDKNGDGVGGVRTLVVENGKMVSK